MMNKNHLSISSAFSFIFGGLAILVFLLILVVTYLPNKPEGIDSEIREQRVNEADTIRAEGVKKLNSLELNATQTAKIPIDRAIELILSEYRQN
tara:strand:- start:924 stop:1205 length:282 start_codon:yes stop_codon:yes gene_type:complete